jgi:predicted PurR-regulated permease PerM
MDAARWLLLSLIAILLLLSVAFVMPFLQYFLLALLLTYLLVPVQRRLETRMRPALSAALVVAATAIAFILPLLLVAQAAVMEAISLIRAIREGDVELSVFEQTIRQRTGIEVDIVEVLQSAATDVQFDSLVSVFGTITHTLIGLGLTLFLLYYFLKDRAQFMHWLYRTVPLSEDVQRRIYDEYNHIMGAVLVGHVFVALIQGVLAGLGLVATGIPDATLWTLVMIVLSLLPVVGSFLVWGPATAYLYLTGDVGLAVGLFLWGAIVVGVSDDYLRPIVVDRYANVSPSVIIIGVLGGVYVIGVMGIFFGPVVIGMLRSTVDLYREEMRDEESPQSVPPARAETDVASDETAEDDHRDPGSPVGDGGN